jgi:hypothetical protein
LIVSLTWTTTSSATGTSEPLVTAVEVMTMS